MSDDLEGTHQLLVSQVDEQPGLTYVLSASIESNSRGYTTSVKANVTVTSLPGEDEPATIERGRIAQEVLLAAGWANIVSRRVAIELGATESGDVEFTRAYGDYVNLQEAFRRFVRAKASAHRPTDV